MPLLSGAVKFDARQATATRERRSANARDTIGYRNARQATATSERRIGYCFRSVFDCVTSRN